MTVRRLAGIPGFAIDEVAARAGSDPEVLRMENLDTDLPPPAVAVAATRAVVGSDDANSYLPFTGQPDLCRAVADRLQAATGRAWDPRREVVITAGGTEGLLDALLATTDPGDEVVLTDPTYAGMINRVRLAGAVPRLVPFRWGRDSWRLDLDALRRAAGPRTRAVLLMNPSMPSGAVLDVGEWSAVAELCAGRDCWLLYNAAMERILYDGRAPIHPAALEPLRHRTVVIGSVSKEYRMIGWRVGWVAAPAEILADIARVHLYNVVTPPGIAQAGAAAALRSPAADLAAAVAEWERRRDAVVGQMAGLPVRTAAGGWSLMLDVAELGLDSFTGSARLLERGRVAATPMRDWGETNGDRFVRLVFSNEPVARLADLGARLRRALAD
ncbi:MAG TPA: pyridoxal phosphate-dependent aminotransferase [Gemmatimonadales bacterium]|nr:pyridoxal phosphate-dependent aminotransferase [Gemmatimonadales bacterium]